MSQKKRTKVEEKIRTAKACINGEISIHTENPDKGYRRIKDDLAHDHNLNVNEKRVLRICRRLDIKSTIKYKKV